MLPRQGARRISDPCSDTIELQHASRSTHVMGGKWFANRGQIVQTLAAIIGTCLAGVGVYFVRKNNHSLPPETSMFYALTAVAIFLLGIWIGRLSKPTQRFFETERSERKDEAASPVIGGSASIGYKHLSPSACDSGCSRRARRKSHTTHHLSWCGIHSND